MRSTIFVAHEPYDSHCENPKSIKMKYKTGNNNSSCITFPKSGIMKRGRCKSNKQYNPRQKEERIYVDYNEPRSFQRVHRTQGLYLIYPESVHE